MERNTRVARPTATVNRYPLSEIRSLLSHPIRLAYAPTPSPQGEDSVVASRCAQTRKKAPSLAKGAFEGVSNVVYRALLAGFIYFFV